VPPLVPSLREDPDVILGRLETAFSATPPLSGRGPHRLWLEHWTGGSGSVPVTDARRQAELATRLEQEWHRFMPRELSPDAEEAARGGSPPSP